MRTVLSAWMTVMVVVLSSTPAMAKDLIDHKPFESILKTYVNKKGLVAYGKLKKNKEDLAKLDAYLKEVAEAKIKGKKRTRLAFYVNAYNALVIRDVVRRWPTKSVMKEKNFFKDPIHTVGGKKLSLDALENKVIRPTFKDARVHFVLVCAAISCPRLRRKAMTERNVHRQLEKAAKEFIPKATTIKGSTVTTSKLFDWFKDDFKHDAGSVEAYLGKYVNDLPKEPTLAYTEYDWTINKR